MEDPATSSITSIWTSINSWFTSSVFFILLNLMIATILFISNLPSSNNNQQQPKQKQEQEHQKQDYQYQNPQDRPKFARSPSILHRLKSFNFYPERPEQELFPETHHQLQALEAAATQYVFDQPLHYEHFDLDIHPTHDEVGRSDFETRVVETETDRFDDSDPITHQQIHTEVSYQEDDEVVEEVEEEETDEFESLDEVYSRLKGGGTHVDRSQSDGVISSKPPPPSAKAKKSMRKSASLKVGFARLEKDEIVEARRPETMREKKSAVRMTAEEDHDDVEVDSKAADFINKFKNDLILQRIESIAARSK